MTPLDLDCDDTIAATQGKPAINGAHAPESFETAVSVNLKEVRKDAGLHSPTDRRAEPTVVDGASRAAGGDPERLLLSCCLIEEDEGRVLRKARDAGIRPEWFSGKEYSAVFSILAYMQDAAMPITAAVLTQELMRSRKLEEFGGFAFITQLTEFAPTTIQSNYFIERIRERAILADTVSAAKAILSDAERFTGGIDDFLADQQARIVRLSRATGGIEATPITTYNYPDGDDPNILLGTDDYLGRGGGFLFVSHAGAGKSSWILDACMSWALAKPWMGIRCNGPLRSLIIQAEDSDRYVGKLRTSFEHVNQTTPEQTAQLGRNCVIVRLKGVSGEAFFSRLRQLTERHKPDLVIINPIYLYAEGDISRSEFCQPFLVGLDAVNREEKFAYILVHHTGKPQAKDKAGKRANVEDWESVYMGFGSSYLANWPRCSALLEPVSGTNGSFVIKLGKGGMNAGVTKQVEHNASTRTEPTTRIPIKHSQAKMRVGDRDRPVYYWEPDTDRTDAEPERQKGRKPTHVFSEFRGIFPAKSEQPLRMKELHRRAMQSVPVKSESQFYNILQRFAEEGSIEIVEMQGGRGYRLAL